MSGYNLKSIKEKFKKQGVFYTPPELAEMLKSYVDFEPKSVYDPTCGDGGLLATFGDSVEKYGQEINGEQLEVAKQRLINFTGVCGDTLKEPAFKGMKFDCILANPPFSIAWQPKVDERFIHAPTIPTQGKADYAFNLHILHYLSENGTAVVLNFPGVLYRLGREQQIRKWLVEQNYIERIVRIPGNTFVDTTIETCLIVYKKNRKSTDIVFEDKALKKERAVSVKEIKSNDYTLSVSTYIQEEVDKPKINPLELQSKARRAMIDKLRKDINIDLMVCEFESLNKFEYLDEIIKTVTEIKISI